MALPLEKKGFGGGIPDCNEDDEDVIAAKTLVQMSRSKSKLDLIYFELCRLEWMCDKMHQEREEVSRRKRKQDLSIGEMKEEPQTKKKKVKAAPPRSHLCDKRIKKFRSDLGKKKKEESAANGMLPAVNLENGGLAQLARSIGPSFLTKKKRTHVVKGRLPDEKLKNRSNMENGGKTQLAYYTRHTFLKENKEERPINGRLPAVNAISPNKELENDGTAQLISGASVGLFDLNLLPPEEESME